MRLDVYEPTGKGRKKWIVDPGDGERNKGGLFVQSRMVRCKGCNQIWSASKARHNEPERSFSPREGVGAAAKRPRRKSRWTAILRSDPAKRSSLRLVPSRAATPPLIRRDSEIAPLWGSVGGVHLGARRRAELLSQRDLSRGAPGTAEHSGTLTRIMESQEDDEVKGGVAAADPHVATRSRCVSE